MAGVVYTFTTTLKVPGLSSLPGDAPVIITGDYSVEVEIDVPAGQVSLHVPIATVDKTKIIAMCINADKSAMNVFSNAAGGSGGQTFDLAKNASVAWNNQMNLTLFPNPILDNVTAFWINNPGVVPGIFRAAFLMQV